MQNIPFGMKANSESRGHNTPPPPQKKKQVPSNNGGWEKVLCSNCNLGMIDIKP